MSGNFKIKIEGINSIQSSRASWFFGNLRMEKFLRIPRHDKYFSGIVKELKKKWAVIRK